MTMKTTKSAIEFVTVCFQNFDSISQKLILTRLKDPNYSIEIMEEPVESDVCFYNQEKDDEQVEIETLLKLLKRHDVPLILLTENENVAAGNLLKVITKPFNNRRSSEFLSNIQVVFNEELNYKLKRKADQKPAKLIYNKHLSNAINPNQIRYESNRFYAQKYVGLTPDIDFDVEEQLTQIQINPQSYFFYYLKAAFALSKQKNKMVCVKTVYGIFYVDALTKLIHHEKNADEIINIHKIPFYKDSQISLPKLKRTELKAIKDMYQFDYEPFVWLSSINASKGKIPNDVNINVPIKLVAWPDLTKLVVFKHAIRIIALWSRGVYSLKQTGRLLNIPQRYPLTIYTALHALGLVTEVKKR